MSKRPSLAESMRQVAAAPEPLPVPIALMITTPALSPSAQPDSSRAFFAATRVGKKKVTAALAPADHKRLKRLTVEHETTTEALLTEAIHDLFNKYDKAATA